MAGRGGTACGAGDRGAVPGACLKLLRQALETSEPPGWTGSEACKGLFEWPSCSPQRPQPVGPERGGKSGRKRVPSVLQECDVSVGKSH